MLAIATQPRSFRRDLHVLNAAPQPQRKNNRLHDRAQLANLCELLVREDLTASAYRVLLDTLARMLRHGITTEAVPVEWMANRLGTHRNAISQAYSQLEAADVLRRVAVKHRGAPTRTRLIGLAAALVDRSLLPALVNHESGPSGPDGPDSLPALVTDEVTMVTDLCAVTIASPSSSAAPEPAEQGRALTFAFDAAINTAMMAKVPHEARTRAMQLHDPSALPVDPAWNLTEGELAHFRALFPKREVARRPYKGPTPKMRPTPELSAALIQSLPRLQVLAGCAAQAHVLADQIAYQTMCLGLGRGNVLAGVRAGVKLVERKVWTEPRDWASQRGLWGGISLRARTGETHEGQAHAQKAVH